MIGETISHYKILEKIGEGGMGVVYKAEDTKLKRIVALKFLASELTRDATAKQRFIQEAQAASKLDHPNICTIYEINETEDGQLYIAMAYYEGETLKEKTDEGPLRIDETLTIAINIAEGLQEAHEHGITHRDIKPSNIMITDKGQTKILDFGLAKSAAGSIVTKAGTTLGTIAIMSPEQVRGEKVDKRTDIWSLGVVIYNMLTGQMPFKGEYEHAIVYSIMNVDPEPITGLRTGVPIELEKIINKCLEKDKSDRYPTAEGLLVDLRKLKKDTSKISAIPPAETMTAVPHEADKVSEAAAKKDTTFTIVLTPKKKLFIGLAAVMTILIIAAAALFLFKPAPVSEGKRLVVLPFENRGTPEDEDLVDGITEEISVKLTGIEGLVVIARSSANQYKNTEKSLQEIGKELDGVEYVLQGTVRWQRSAQAPSRIRVTPRFIRVSDGAQLWADTYDEDVSEVFRVQSDIAVQVAGALGIALSEPEKSAMEEKLTDVPEAYEYYLRGNDYYNRSYEEQDHRIAEQMYQNAIDIDSNFAEAYAKLSQTHSIMYWFYYDRSEERLSMAKDAVDKAFNLEPDLPEAHLALGYYYYHGYLDYDNALEQFDIVRKSQPNNSKVLAAIGYVQRRQGKFEQAAANMKKASELDPLSGRLAEEVGDTYMLIRNYPEAEQYYDRAISLIPDLTEPYGWKAKLYLIWEGRTEKSREVLEQGLHNVGAKEEPYVVIPWILTEVFDGYYQKAIDKISSVTLEALETQFYFIPKAQLYAQVYGLMGNRQLEQAYYDSARSILESKIQESPKDERFRSSLGIAYAGLERKDNAIREGKLAVELLPVSKEAWRGLYRLEDLARIYVMVGEYDLAIDQLEFLLSNPGELSIPLLRLDPVWDPLREHPRFQKLLEGGK